MHEMIPMLAIMLLCSTVTSAASVIDELDGTRDPKFFFQAITIRPDPCTTTSNTNGVCYKSTDCSALGGQALGTCALGLGVCCFITQTCGSTITTNSTSFVSPSTSDDAQSCRSTIDIQNQNICQVRLDFNTFDIREPDNQGVCEDDFLIISGTTNDDAVPRLCGLNTGQHIYLNVDPAGGNPILNIDTTGDGVTRDWDIQVTKIECGSQYAAPNGCLQYYTETSGTITSFNYEATVRDDYGPPPSAELRQHLANLNYAACIAPQTDFCSARWTPTSETSFVIFGDVSAAVPTIGDPAIGALEAFDIATTNPNGPCTDYITLVGGVAADSGNDADRYCGWAFPSEVETERMPFKMYVLTDDNEAGDTLNSGFSLDYRLLPCP